MSTRNPVGHIDGKAWAENAAIGVDKKGKAPRRHPGVDTAGAAGTLCPRQAWDIRAEKPCQYNDDSIVVAYRPEIKGMEWCVCRITTDGWAYGCTFYGMERAARDYFNGWNGWI